MSEIDSSQFTTNAERKSKSDLADAIIPCALPIVDAIQEDDPRKATDTRKQIDRLLADVPLERRIGSLATPVFARYAFPEDEGEFLTLLLGSDGITYPVIRKKSWRDYKPHIENIVIDPSAWNTEKIRRQENNAALVKTALSTLDEKIGQMAEKGTIARERIERLLKPFQSVDEAVAAGWTQSEYAAHMQKGEHEELDWWQIDTLQDLFNPEYWDGDDENGERAELRKNIQAAIIRVAKPSAAIVAPYDEITDEVIYPFVDKNGETFIFSGAINLEEQNDDDSGEISEDQADEESTESDMVTENMKSRLSYYEGDVMKSVMERARKDKTEELRKTRAEIAGAYATATKVLDDVSEVLRKSGKAI